MSKSLPQVPDSNISLNVLSGEEHDGTQNTWDDIEKTEYIKSIPLKLSVKISYNAVGRGFRSSLTFLKRIWEKLT